MGTSEILPGISGSTTALIMGIYDDFINLLFQISLIIKTKLDFVLRRATLGDLKKSFLDLNFKFAIPLLIGMVTAIISLSHVLTYALESYPNYIFAFFFGLGISSVTIPFGELKNKNLKNFLIVLTSFSIAFFIFGLKGEKVEGTPSYLILLVSGIIGITGTIIPGASGSYLLIVTGAYDYIIGTIKDFSSLNFSMDQFTHLSIFALGLLIGFVVFIRIVKYGLNKSPDTIMSIIIGVMLGALRVTYPFVSNPEDPFRQVYLPFTNASEYNSYYVLLCILSAVVLIVFMQKYSDRNQFSKLNKEAK